MRLGGLQKLTLIDYPRKIATTVFTIGCNFKCPFCHNPELVLTERSLGQESVSEESFFSFLDNRKDKLDGVCITGGEPTIQPDILDFMKKIKKMGFLVKLDSNGSRPDVLKKALEQRIVDFIAMDIKSSIENYPKICGIDIDVDRVKLSVELIKNSGVKYEFRTTVVPEIHIINDFEKIALWLKGSERYVIQKYNDQDKILDEGLKQKQKNVMIDMEEIKKIVESSFHQVKIR